MEVEIQKGTGRGKLKNNKVFLKDIVDSYLY